MQSGAPPSGATRGPDSNLRRKDHDHHFKNGETKATGPQVHGLWLQQSWALVWAVGVKGPQGTSPQHGLPAAPSCQEPLQLLGAGKKDRQTNSLQQPPPCRGPGGRRRGLTEASSSQPASDNSATGVATVPSRQLRPVGPTDGFYRLAWSQHDKKN